MSNGQINTSFPGRQRFSYSFAAVECEQNGHVALPAETEIPSRVGLGPSRNIQRISLPSEMPELLLSYFRPVSGNNIRPVLIRTFAPEPASCAVTVFRSSRIRVRSWSLALR